MPTRHAMAGANPFLRPLGRAGDDAERNTVTQAGLEDSGDRSLDLFVRLVAKMTHRHCPGQPDPPSPQRRPAPTGSRRAATMPWIVSPARPARPRPGSLGDAGTVRKAAFHADV